MIAKRIKYSVLLMVFLISTGGSILAQDAEPPAPAAKRKPAATATKVNAPETGTNELTKGRGKLFVKETSWDFGHVVQDAQVSHAFFLENAGDDTLFIERIKPT